MALLICAFCSNQFCTKLVIIRATIVFIGLMMAINNGWQLAGQKMKRKSNFMVQNSSGFIINHQPNGGITMITLEQAKNLKYGQVLYHCTNRNADGTPQRWRVNGKPQTWKRSPEIVRKPV
jgi:hypothetical protein